MVSNLQSNNRGEVSIYAILLKMLVNAQAWIGGRVLCSAKKAVFSLSDSPVLFEKTSSPRYILSPVAIKLPAEDVK